MSQPPLFSASSLSRFREDIYQHLYVAMTRVLNDIFERIAECLYVIHAPLLPRKTQCLLTYMYLYFLNPRTQKCYTHLSDYYLKKHLCDMAYVNADTDFPRYEYRQRITHRFHHYALRLELIFRSLLPDMLSSLCQLESYPPKDRDTYSRFRLREILFTFQ